MMNIYAKKGDKVVFQHPDAGYIPDQETAREHLTVGEEYTIRGTVVDTFSTTVYLQEFPGVAFNSVHFEDIS